MKVVNATFKYFPVIFATFKQVNGVFSEWSGTFIEFSEFREYEGSLKHKLGSVKGSALLPVSLWSSGIISVSYKGDLGSQSHNPHF